MPNANTILRPIGGLPATGQGASSTSEFQLNMIPPAANAADAAAFIKIPAGYLGQGKPFRIIAGGRSEVGSGNLTLNVDSGTSTTPASNTTFWTSGAVAATDGSWMIILEGYVEPNNDVLMGVGYGYVGTTAVAMAAFTALASFDPAVEQQISVTGTFSGSDAANLATLEFFEVQAL